MNTPTKVYNKRLIFDHLEKTAGQAVRKWMQDELGSGCVTKDLIGIHRNLISEYGGDYSVISGHLKFYGEGLDPRYQYITLFREPVDRVISRLFFSLKNHTSDQIGDLYSWTEDFVNSDGEKINTKLLHYISNKYTNHFIRIENSKIDFPDQEKVSRALSVIKRYDVVGLYEQMPEFLADVSDLLGIPAPKSLARVNVTKSRPAVDQVSSKLRQRIVDLNQMDIHLYNEVVSWKRSQSPKNRAEVLVSPWQKYEPVHGNNSPIIQNFFGNISLVGELQQMRPDEKRKLIVKVYNAGHRAWVGDNLNPVRISYHWYDQAGKPVVYDGLRTALPSGGVVPRKMLELEMLLQAPNVAGQYKLVLTLVQEKVSWFENQGFQPCVLNVDIS